MATLPYLTQCHFDHGALQQLGALLRRLGMKRPFFVTDPALRAMGLADLALAQIPGGPAAIYDQTPANPTEAAAQLAAQSYREHECDGLIAFGGGSAMDLAKGVGLFVTHAPPFARLGASQRGTRHIGPIPPLIAIPTTSGTGSEVSVGAVLILEDGRKETFISNHLIPTIALCDPDLTLGLPALLTAATGMDAVTHCLEAFLAPAINPPADAIGLDGLQRAIGQNWLPAAVQDGQNKEARWNMMMASYEGALAFVKGLGGAHSLSHASGRLKELRLHHGTLNAIYLPHILAFNYDAKNEKYDRAAQVMGVKRGADLPQKIADLNAQLGLPANLRAIGMRAEHQEDVVAFAQTDLAHYTNPRPISAADYSRLFSAALG